MHLNHFRDLDRYISIEIKSPPTAHAQIRRRSLSGGAGGLPSKQAPAQKTVEEHGDLDRPSRLMTRMLFHPDRDAIQLARQLGYAWFFPLAYNC